MSSSAITKTESDLPVPTTTSSSQADLKLPEAESVPEKIITGQNNSSGGSAKSNSADEESTQSIIPTKPFTSEKASINGTEHQLNVDRGFQNSTSQIGILPVANSNSAFSNKTNPKKDLRPDEFIS
ncbi:hypothetical protein EDEG_02097 [Edhazardia aedis USNM 41457]|uniref:Uncharacterized protein n=1 Tax=Edhazardia aedis (strain USNM 41457) TaxID=1003232 RepID=J9DLX7_EDHAE|nr:hypothetical protein EDEG_02097 [Edhazardia aedis USNM 41457]|eukprot:EJW03585.1 hypothetical protein EDEG_02097 [Edhazardia aedis USNM 41457]